MNAPAGSMSGELLPDDLAAWIGNVLRAPLASVQEIMGGGSRQSAIVTTNAGTQAFLRRETGRGPLAGTPFTLRREHSVIRFLEHSAVPVPRCHAYSPEHDAILMDVVPGFTTYEQPLSAGEQALVQRRLMAAIVALQAIDPSAIPELSSRRDATLRDVIANDLATWEALYRERVATPDPLIEFALGWLGHANADATERPVIVHGDIGPGNFIVHETQIAALIDWEMVRVGHPLEDVACIIARGLGAPFGAARDHIANYEAIRGLAVDPVALDFALVLVLVRWNIAISIGLARPTATQNVPMLLAFRQINARALIAAIRRHEGLAEPEGPPPPSRPNDRAAVVPVLAFGDVLLGEFAQSERLAPSDRHRLAGLGELLNYLGAYIDYGPERYEAEDVARVSRLLGQAPDGATAARDALCAYARLVDEGGIRPLVAHFHWRVEREHQIMRGFLGARADNYIDLERSGDAAC